MRDLRNQLGAAGIATWVIGLTIFLTYLEGKDSASKPVIWSSPIVIVALSVTVAGLLMFGWVLWQFRRLSQNRLAIDGLLIQGNQLLQDLLRTPRRDGLHKEVVDWAGSVRSWFQSNMRPFAGLFNVLADARTARDFSSDDPALQELAWRAIEEGHRTRILRLKEIELAL